jgi:N-acetylglucosamine-6-phosphate deacetylase
MKHTNTFHWTRLLRSMIALMVILSMLLCGCAGSDTDGKDDGKGNGGNSAGVLGDGDGKLETEDHVKAMQMHLKHGVTAMTPTPGTIDPAQIRILADIKAKIDAREDLPHHLGYFMEGPLTQPHPDMGKPGEKPPIITPEMYEEALDAAVGVVNRWMAAPELEGGMAFGRALRAHGITGCMGHSNATIGVAKEALDHGYTHLTHFYSGMSMVRRINAYRYAGVLEAGYAIDECKGEDVANLPW